MSDWVQWLIPVISATQDADIRGSQGSPVQKSRFYLKKYTKEKRNKGVWLKC
jgi:hypothetical protein